ncbi:hypothetical protein SO802_029519 [Lithocarpus litseifolius]|uniref:Uncharacterized protein n=1 Tax=Lithocarpus litseifolius TaxID=425828 RepID=A0AAW2BZ13_9ROSI
MDYGQVVEMKELLCSPPIIRTSLILLCCASIFTEATQAETVEELLKSGNTDVVLGGHVKFLEQKILENAKAAEVAKLMKSDNTDIDVEGFVKFLKKKKLENAEAAVAKELSKIYDSHS